MQTSKPVISKLASLPQVCFKTPLLARLTSQKARRITCHPLACTHGKGSTLNRYLRLCESAACNIIREKHHAHRRQYQYPSVTQHAPDAAPLLTPPCCLLDGPPTTITPHPLPTQHTVRPSVLRRWIGTTTLRKEGPIGGRSRAEPTFPREGYGRLDRHEHRDDGGGR